VIVHFGQERATWRFAELSPVAGLTSLSSVRVLGAVRAAKGSLKSPTPHCIGRRSHQWQLGELIGSDAFRFFLLLPRFAPDSVAASNIE